MPATITTTTTRVDAIPPPAPAYGSRGKRNVSVWEARLREPREHPGEWFQLPGDFSEAVAGQIKSGRVSGVARGEFATKRRRLPNGRYLVFVSAIPGFCRDTAPVSPTSHVRWHTATAATVGGLVCNEVDGVPLVADVGEDGASFTVPVFTSSGRPDGWTVLSRDEAFDAMARARAAGWLDG